MNVLFLTIAGFDSIYQSAIYPDLLREFMKKGHAIYVISPLEKRYGCETEIKHEENCHILKVKVGNITKSGMIEKGIATLLIESQYKKAVAMHFSDVKFDLILYSTPPITLCSVIEFVKKRDGAKTYLLLKDIFPQNAVDIGVITKKGWKGLIYNFFRNKEKKLYKISDYIGCMSQANVDYVLNHNPELNPATVEVCPNSVEIIDMEIGEETRRNIRKKYDIPLDKKVFIYGGNLGKPQGIGFMIDCIKSQEKNKDIFFLIIGDGTEYGKIENYINSNMPANVKLMRKIPKEDYDKIVYSCDVGLIFLDYRFTIPNFPSRLLSYMQAGLPVLAVTDKNTDIGTIIVNGEFGWWCESKNVDGFDNIIQNIIDDKVSVKGINGKNYLKSHYTVNIAYEIIAKKIKWI